MGSQCVVMVGNLCQLPATVLFDVSLLDRLSSLGLEVQVLSVRYRMHPLIAEFPSRRFYDHKLETGIRPEERPAMPVNGMKLGMMAIVHVGEAGHSPGMSKSIPKEADCVEHIVRALSTKRAVSDVGVIAPYSAQVQCIRQSLRSIGSQAEQVKVSSVDAFQGTEKEAIVLFKVRSN